MFFSEYQQIIAIKPLTYDTNYIALHLDDESDGEEAVVLNSIYLYVWILAFNAYLAVFISFLFAERNKLVNRVTLLVGLGTVWIFAEVALRLGVGPSAEMWFEFSEVCLMLIPYVLYMAISAETGKNLFSVTSVFVGALCFIEVAFGMLGLYYSPVFETVSGFSESMLIIDNIHMVSCHPRMLSIVMVMGNLVTTGLCVKEILTSERIVYRKLLLTDVILYCLITTANIYIPGQFPLDLVAGVMNGVIFMFYLRQKKILTFKGMVSHKLFPFLSSLTVTTVILIIYFRDWGMMASVSNSLLIVIFISTVVTSLITLLFEGLYSRFFLDKGDYILKCSASYHEDLIPLLGNIEDIAALFRENCEKVYGITHMALFVLDEKTKRFTLCGKCRYSNLSFENKSELAEHARMLKGPQSAWNVIKYLDEDSKSILDDIEERNLTVFSPLTINEQLLGFYLMGGGRISNIDSVDRASMSTFNRTTGMAIASSQMTHQLERNAFIDILTGLNDRNATKKKLLELVESKRDFVFLLFNIDDLKLYNMVFSLNTGDEIIATFASVLRDEADENIILGRVSGRSFAAFVLGSHDEAVEYDRNVRYAFREINRGTERENVTFSTGLYEVSGKEDNDPTFIIKAAKAAEAEAKKHGQNNLFEFEPGLDVDLHSYESGFQIGTVEAIAKALDLRDHLTFNHSSNVAEYACAIAETIGLSAIDCQIIFEAGLVHDIGKISIPDSILLNPGRLTDEEYEIMKTHVDRGRDVIESLPHGFLMVPIAMTHHERWDGCGYPAGLSGEEIPIGGRCLAIADTFDAMTSKRVYRNAFTVDEALDEILRVSGTQLDPELGPLFVNLVREGRITPHPSRN